MKQLYPQYKSLLEAMNASRHPPLFTLPVPDARRARRVQLVVHPPRVQIAAVEDDLVPGPLGGIPVRWYRPRPDAGLPVTVYFHGGGWTVDDLDTHDHLCRRLASQSGAVVVSVAYRRGPEHPYPAAVDDAYAATAWVAATGRERAVDPARLAVAGDSAGGNLAAVVALLCRDRRGPALRFQALAYPVTDHWQAGQASYRQYAEGYTLTRDFMKWTFRQYLPDGVNRADPYLFPLHAADLSGLPAALSVTAQPGRLWSTCTSTTRCTASCCKKPPSTAPAARSITSLTRSAEASHESQRQASAVSQPQLTRRRFQM